mmetsp:Transcript_91906/g.231045  ORF Transcript_91906/g.231045 Transcript_91906/m.231045 type:complete len:220 (-) Transcript_91906:698-1357(-)
MWKNGTRSCCWHGLPRKGRYVSWWRPSKSLQRLRLRPFPKSGVQRTQTTYMFASTDGIGWSVLSVSLGARRRVRAEMIVHHGHQFRQLAAQAQLRLRPWGAQALRALEMRVSGALCLSPCRPRLCQPRSSSRGRFTHCRERALCSLLHPCLSMQRGCPLAMLPCCSSRLDPRSPLQARRSMRETARAVWTTHSGTSLQHWANLRHQKQRSPLLTSLLHR